MSTLYSTLAPVYEAMYQTFIDYKEEYTFYANILRQHNKKSVTEIGSGTGNLAGYFNETGFSYTGLDYSTDMIAIAQQKYPNAKFVQGDMRNFQLKKTEQSILITARSLSYITANEDVISTFKSIANNLEVGGILAFDIIDAVRFIPEMQREGNITHFADYEGISYRRDSIWTPNLSAGLNLNWSADYLQKEGEDWKRLGTDAALVRTFTQNEICIYAELCGFDVLNITDRPSYFFPTYVFTLRKR
jgi:SAM-dependent methyltransferase